MTMATLMCERQEWRRRCANDDDGDTDDDGGGDSKCGVSDVGGLFL